MSARTRTRRRPGTSRPRSVSKAGATARRWSLHGAPFESGASAHFYARATWLVAATLSVALLAVILGPHRVGDYFAETDFYGAYADGARAIQRGVLDPSRYGVVGPGYEVALALVGFVARDLLLGAELLSLVSVVAGVLLWTRLLARRADPRLGLATALFLAVNSTLFRYGYSATNDALAFALQAAALYLLLAREGTRAALLAGTLAGLAFLTRYNALALAPAGLVALLGGGTLQSRRRHAALWFTLGLAAPVLPWVLYSFAHGGGFLFQFHHNIAYDVFALPRGIAWDDYQKLLQPQFKSLWDVIARDPRAVLGRELFNLWDHLRSDAVRVVGTPVAACAALGLVLAWSDGTLRRLWPVWLAWTLQFLTLVPVFHSGRYSLPLLPAYLSLAAAAFASPRFAIAVGRTSRLWLKPLLAGIPLVLAGQATVRDARHALGQLPHEVLDCGRALHALARPDDRVIARKPHIGFHSGLATVPFPFADSLPDLAAYARERGARWLFFSWPEAELRPAFWYLLDTSAAVPGLIVRHSTERPAVLYEIGPGFGAVPAWFRNDTLRSLHTAVAHLRVYPADTASLIMAAFIESRREQWDSARRRLELAVRLDPRSLPAWLLLGDVLLQMGDGQRAAAAFERAQGVDPNRVEARIGRGLASLLLGRPEEAAAVWRPVVGAVRDAAALERMAELYRALGDQAAEAEARAALARLRGRS